MDHISRKTTVPLFVGILLSTGVLLVSLPLNARGSQPVKEHEDFLCSIIKQAARRYRIEIEMIRAIIMAESAYHAGAVSESGALGLMRLMPATAEALGVVDCFDPEQNINAGARYLQILMKQFDGDIILALAAYHARPTRVKKCRAIPEIAGTKLYVLRVLRYYRDYKKEKVKDKHLHSPAL